MATGLAEIKVVYSLGEVLCDGARRKTPECRNKSLSSPGKQRGCYSNCHKNAFQTDRDEIKSEEIIRIVCKRLIDFMKLCSPVMISGLGLGGQRNGKYNEREEEMN